MTPCRKDGGTFSLSGCEPDACRSFPVNDFKSGYVVCHGRCKTGGDGVTNMACSWTCSLYNYHADANDDFYHSLTWIIAPVSKKTRRGGEKLLATGLSVFFETTLAGIGAGLWRTGELGWEDGR